MKQNDPQPCHVLLIHQEVQYFAGAEKVLLYFLDELVKGDSRVSVAVVKGSRTDECIPASVSRVWIPANPQFSLAKYLAQLKVLRQAHASQSFDVVHGWAARDWELSVGLAQLIRRPAMGTLHDHPQAEFITGARRRLMRWCANWGLKHVVCVSQAVATACEAAGYRKNKLSVIHNGLPASPPPAPASAARAQCRFGFLGAFSERKGLRDLFASFEQLEKLCPGEWELKIGGDAQDEAGRALLANIRERFGARGWWSRIHWQGWVQTPRDFLAGVDCLVVPSAGFDPFPTVLLEAAQAGLPVVASRVGGVAEIVDDGRTGWLFQAGDELGAAEAMARIVRQPQARSGMGLAARRRLDTTFTTGKMVLEYRKRYANLTNHGK